MSGIMPVNQRNRLMESLKEACQKYLAALKELDLSATDSEERETRHILKRHRTSIIRLWQAFPECWEDDPALVPSAQTILDSIKRQEKAIEWAKRLEGK